MSTLFSGEYLADAQNTGSAAVTDRCRIASSTFSSSRTPAPAGGSGGSGMLAERPGEPDARESHELQIQVHRGLWLHIGFRGGTRRPRSRPAIPFRHGTTGEVRLPRGEAGAANRDAAHQSEAVSGAD